MIVDIRPDPAARDFDGSIDVLLEAGLAGLIGDHVDDPVGTSTPDVVRSVVDRGLPVVATVACRNRSVGQCRQSVERLIDAGATGILCVTGDHPAARFGPNASATFALDSTRLSSVARSVGAYVVVAESPSSPPRHGRARRTLEKQRAGADLVILNHCGGVADLERFAIDLEDEGTTMPIAAPVPVVSDLPSLRALTAFPGLELAPELIRDFCAASDPGTAGIESAISLGRRLRRSGRFAHLNLSGRATKRGHLERCRIMARVAEGIRQS
ncbi:methylenetetrahydrofolate reductase [Ilumatobacter nonamiensis]|uniref:methylenetetrahydrofolate reductase n=1 Tax=Ilumatobacter nonamiensis TaxID=467093 RepID=UPI0011D22C6D|nr:methylenetetrahydrofolate reductase [Ilumatobacter nonamiensis]